MGAETSVVTMDVPKTIPNFQKDTISSWTSRAIARRMPIATSLEARREASKLRKCHIPMPDYHVDPDEHSIKVWTSRDKQPLQKVKF